jgi:protease I
VLKGKKILMIIAPENFRDEELQEPKAIFEKNGAKVTVSSRTKGECSGMLGGKANADAALKEVNADDFDAVIFVGGSGSAVYFNDETVLKIARDASAKGKVIGAICIAPSILANAGIMKGKKATSFSSERDNLQAKGVIYTGESVVIDGKIITADGPKSAREFGEAVVSVMGKK